jgi:hypothetical protein
MNTINTDERRRDKPRMNAECADRERGQERKQPEVEGV